jgi:hypothetical protein
MDLNLSYAVLDEHHRRIADAERRIAADGVSFGRSGSRRARPRLFAVGPALSGQGRA